MKVITDEYCTGYEMPGHPERPARIEATRVLLENQKSLKVDWVAPGPCSDDQVLRAHTPEHLARLDEAGDFDVDTPWFDGIGGLARTSVGAALEALRLARAGEQVFSLMRPPGHHATPDQAMGFCYLGNAAIAALEALETGSKRVAIFDFDVHHGNGTEAILAGRKGVRFYSVHQSPCYPGTGMEDVGGNCFNRTVKPFVPRMEYRMVLRKAFDEMVDYKPDLVAVSAGFDSYLNDPLAQGTLEVEDFNWLGTLFAKLEVPVFSLLEGGYSDDLPELIHAYLCGLEGK